MSYRTIEFSWLPDAQRAWQTFTASRREAARLWNDLVIRHARIRRLHWQWPSVYRWSAWAKGRYPHLHSQSIQQIIAEFCEAVNAITQLRKKGHAEARYPWRLHRYRDVIYTNQGARLRDGYLILPHGQSGRLRIPDGITLPGRLMEVRLCYGRVLVVCEILDEVRFPTGTIGVDLGVNTLIAATNSERAIVISGREAKATVQWRNKKLAGIQAAQAKKQKGSKRWLKLQRRKHKMLDKAKRRIKDICHKATRQVADT
ncbi:MAG: transposase, partial [Ardenticatenales bacterium]|nr:transposase [Ardenticatenales bacterium]